MTRGTRPASFVAFSPVWRAFFQASALADRPNHRTTEPPNHRTTEPPNTIIPYRAAVEIQRLFSAYVGTSRSFEGDRPPGGPPLVYHPSKKGGPARRAVNNLGRHFRTAKI